jgi:flavodoxin I
MSTKIGLFYGTQTGKTADVAEMIQKELGEDVADLHDIAGAQKEDLEGYE